VKLSEAQEPNLLQTEMNLEELARQVASIEDVLTCTIVGEDGEVRGRASLEERPSELPLPGLGKLVTGVWGALRRVETMGGTLRVVTANFEKLKLIGFAIPGTRYLMVVGVPIHIDSTYIRDRVLQYVSNWVGER
jgi:hypothetical protein